MSQNNITRYLDAKKIPYTTFDLPVQKLTALETARLLQVLPEQILKSIVVLRSPPGKPVLAIIPGPLEVDLKLLAGLLGEKKMVLATQKQAEQLTGMKAGGISPLALLNRGFQFCLDETALLFDEIHISGGQWGLNIRLRLDDLIQLIHPMIGNITEAPH